MDKKLKNKTQVMSSSRRQRENNTFADIADTLPIQENAKDLDKASILRLAIHYLKLRDLIRDGNDLMEGEREEEGEEEKKEEGGDGGGDDVGLPGTPLSSVSSGSLQSVADPTITDYLPNFSKDVIQALDGFFLVLSSDGRVLFTSESIANYLGLRQVDVIGVRVEDLIHPQDCSEVKRIFQSQGHDTDQMFDDKEPFRRKFVVRMRCAFTPSVRSITRCSNFKPIYCSCFLKFGKSGPTKGQFLGLVVFCKLATITRIKDMVVGTFFKTKHSLDLSYTKVDTRIRWILGYDPSEMTGLKAYQYFHPQDLDVTSSCHMNLLSNGISHSPCYRFMTRWGDWMWCRSKSHMLFNKKSQLPEGIVIYTWVVRMEEEDDRMVAIQRGENGEEHRKKYDTFSSSISAGNGSLDVSALANPHGEPLGTSRPVTPPLSHPAGPSPSYAVKIEEEAIPDEPHPLSYVPVPLSAESASEHQSSASPSSSVGVTPQMGVVGPQMGMPCSQTGVASMPSPPMSMPSSQMGVASMPSPPMSMPSSQMGVANMSSPPMSIPISQMGVASMASPPMGMPSLQMGVASMPSPPMESPLMSMAMSSPPMSMPSPQGGVTYPTPPHSHHGDTDSFMHQLLTTCDGGMTDLFDPSSTDHILSPPYTPYFAQHPLSNGSPSKGNVRKISPPYPYVSSHNPSDDTSAAMMGQHSPPFNGGYDTSPLPSASGTTVNPFESPMSSLESQPLDVSPLYATDNVAMPRYSSSHMTSNHAFSASQSMNLYGATSTHQATPTTFVKKINCHVTRQSSSDSLSPSFELHTTFVPHGNATGVSDPINYPLGVDITMETLNEFDYSSSQAKPLHVRQDLVNSKRAMYSGAIPTGHVTSHMTGGGVHSSNSAKPDEEMSNSISQWSQWLQERAPPPILL